MKFLFLLLSFFFSLAAWAQTYDLGEGLTITQQQLDQIHHSLPTLKEDQVFYHWAAPEQSWRWIKQGYIDRGEMDFLTKPSGDLQAHGGGYYLAKSPTSSTRFGSVPTAVEIKKGTPQYNSEVVTKILGKSLSSQQQSELGRHIPLFRDINGDWGLISSPDAATRVSYGGRFATTAADNKGALHLHTLIAQLAQEDPQHYGYLQSLTHLMNYQDGVAFVRSVREHPENPWGEFDPHTFENYKNTSSQYFAEAAQGKKFGITYREKFGEPGLNPEQWADKQMALLKEIHEGVAGVKDSPYREDRVVGGGDVKVQNVDKKLAFGGTKVLDTEFFEVTKAQLAELKSSPYLQIEEIGMGLKYPKVRIHYPDVLEFHRFEALMSPELFKELKAKGNLEKLPVSEIRNLNSRFIENLTKTRFQEAANLGTDPKLFKDLISIHPYEDTNGRSLRLMQRLAASDSGQKIPYYALSDLDVLTSTKLQDELLAGSNKDYEKWLGDLLAEAQTAKREHRVPRLLEYPHEARMSSMLASLGAKPSWSSEDMRKIRGREWAPLLESWIGPRWQEFRETPMTELLKAPDKFIDEHYSIADYNKMIKSKIAGDPSRLSAFFGMADAKTYPAFVEAFSEMTPSHASLVRDVPKMWLQMEHAGTLKSLSKDEFLNFAMNAQRSMNLNAVLKDHQLAELVEHIAKLKDPTEHFMGLTTTLSEFEGKPGSEFSKALDKLFTKDLKGLGDLQRTRTLELLQAYSVIEGHGPHVDEFLSKNFSTLNSVEKKTFFNNVAELKQGTAAEKDLKSRAVKFGMIEMRNNPAEMSKVPKFFTMVEPQQLDKRDMVNILTGLRKEKEFDTTAIGIKLSQMELSPGQIAIIERELEKVHRGRLPETSSYWTLLKTLAKAKPDSPALDSASRYAISKNHVGQFLKYVPTWTEALNADFLADPGKYYALKEHMLIGLENVKKPFKDVDILLNDIWTNGGAKDSRNRILKYAAHLNQSETLRLNATIQAGLDAATQYDGLKEFVNSRPYLKKELRERVPKMQEARYSNIGVIFADEPETLAILADRVYKKELNPILGNGRAFNPKSPDYSAIRNENKALWDNIKSTGVKLSVETETSFIVNHGSPEEMAKYISRDSRAMTKWLSIANESKGNETSQIVKYLLAMESPPRFVRNGLYSAMANRSYLGKAVQDQLKDLDKLRPWQEEIWNRRVLTARGSDLFHIGFDLGYRPLKTDAAVQMSKIYLRAPGIFNTTAEIKDQITLYEGLKRMNLDPAKLSKDDAEAVQKVSKSILKENWSPGLIEKLGQNDDFWTTVKGKVIDDSRLDPAMKEKLKKRLDSGYRYNSEADRDLIYNLSSGKGRLSEAKIANWMNYNTCSGSVSRFIKSTKKSIVQNLPF